MMENGSTKRDSDKSYTLRLSKSKGSQDRKSFTFGRSSKNKSTGIIPPTSIIGQSSGSLDETKENNSIDGESITSKDALPSEEKFSGQGITFKAKLIGVDPVTGPRGDKMCQSALQRLKALIKETGSHKQRIIIKISLEGVTIKDEKSGESISSYLIPLISYIARDASDKRAFGFVYGSPDTGHQFIGIKTEKSAIPVMKTIGELFTYVYEQKKRNQSVDSGTCGEVSIDVDLVSSSNVETKSKSSSIKNQTSNQLENSNPPPLPPPRNESAAFESNGNAFTANFDDAFVNMSNLKDVIASAKQASDPYATWESFDDEFASLALDASGRSKSSQRSNASATNTAVSNSLPVIPSPPRSPGRTKEPAAILKIKPPANNSRKNKSGPSSIADGPSGFANFANINDPAASFDGSVKSLSASSGRAESQTSLDQAFRDSISSRQSGLSESEQQHQLKLQFQQLHQQSIINNHQRNTALFNSSFSSHGGNSFGSPTSGSLANSFSSSGAAGLFTSPPSNQLADSYNSSLGSSKIPQQAINNQNNFASASVASGGYGGSPSASIFGSPATNSLLTDQYPTSITSSPAISSMANTVTATPVTSPYNGVGVSGSNIDLQQQHNTSNNSNTSSSGDRYAVFSEIHSMTSSIFDKLAEEKKKQEQQEAQYHQQQQQQHQLHLQQQQIQKNKLQQQQQYLALRQKQYEQQQHQLALQQQQQQQILYQQQMNQNQASLMNGFNPLNAFETRQFVNNPSGLVNAVAQAASTQDLTSKSSSTGLSSNSSSNTPPRPSRPESQKSNDPFEMSSIFADLDPLGVGKEKPLLDKSEFFQELKSQQKKPNDETGSMDATNMGKESDPFNIPTELLAQAHLTHLNQHHQAHLLQQQQLLQQAQQQQQHALQLQQQQQAQLQLAHQQQQQQQLQLQQQLLRQQHHHHISPHLQHQSASLSSVGHLNTNSFHVSSSSPSPQTLQELRPSSSASAASRNPFLSDTQSDSSDDLFANSPVLSSPIPSARTGANPASVSASVYPSVSSVREQQSSPHSSLAHNRISPAISDNNSTNSNTNNNLVRTILPSSTTSTPPPLPIALQSTTVTTQPHNISFPLSKGFSTSTRKLSFDSEVFQPNWSSMITNSGASSEDVAAVLGNATAMITTTSMIIAGNSNMIHPTTGNPVNLNENASIVSGIVNNPSACNTAIESFVAANRSVTPLSIDSRSSRSPSSLSNPRFSEVSSSSNARFSPYAAPESFINPSLENLSPLPPPRPPPREFHDTSNSSQSTSRDGSPPPPVPPRPMKSDADCDMPPPPLPKRKPSIPNNVLSSSSLSMISGELGASIKPSANPFYGSSESKSFGSSSVQPPETFAPPLPLPQRKLQSRSSSSLKGYNLSSNANDVYINNRQLQSQYQKVQQSQQLNPNNQLAASQLSITPTTSMASASSSGMYDPFDCAFVTNTLHLNDASRTSNNISPRSDDRSSPRPGLTTGSFSVSQTPISNHGDDRLLDNNSLSRSVMGLDEVKLSRGSSYSSDSLPAVRLNLSNSFEVGKHLERFSTPLSAFGDSIGKPYIHHQRTEINPNEGLNLNSSGSYSMVTGETSLQTSAIKSTPQLSQISNITRITPGFIDSFTGHDMSFNTSEDANNSIFEPWKPMSSLEKSNSLTEAILRSSPASSVTGTNSTIGLGALMMPNIDHNLMNQNSLQQQFKSSLDPNDISGRNPSPFNHFGEEHVSPPERNIFRKESDPFSDDFFQPDTSSS